MPSAPEPAISPAKIMFEVYREGTYDRRYRVCYFTELDDRNRDAELDRCLSGETFLSGYILRASRAEARAVIAAALERLNDGEALAKSELEHALRRHLA